MKCFFCFAEGESPRLSKEHVLSKPVARAFGIDRSTPFGRFGNNDDAIALTPLRDLAVKIACGRCNNTWMNALEHQFAKLGAWAQHGSEPLTIAQAQTLRRWSLKTYLVLSVLEGKTRRFHRDPQISGVIPNVSRARLLYEEDDQVFERMGFGLARTEVSGQFAYAFGNPTVRPQGPRHASVKSAGLAIVTLGLLQVWVVDPTIFSPRITFPPGVSNLDESTVSFADLQAMPRVPRLEEVVVDNGQHDLPSEFERLLAWARDR